MQISQINFIFLYGTSPRRSESSDLPRGSAPKELDIFSLESQPLMSQQIETVIVKLIVITL